MDRAASVLTRFGAAWRSTRNRINQLRQEFRDEEKISRARELAWHSPTISHEEARRVLLNVGHELETRDIDEDFLLDDGKHELALMMKLICLDKYLEETGSRSSFSIFRSWITVVITNLAFIVPGARSRGVNQAILYEPATATPVGVESPSQADEGISVREFGRRLVRHVDSLANPNLQTQTEEEHRALRADIIGISERFDACGEYASSVGEGIARLQAAATRKLFPESLHVFTRISGSFFLAGLAAIVAGPWSNLGNKTVLNGVSSLLLPLTGFMLASAALCAMQRELMTRRLCHRTLAAAKTIGKATTAIFGMFTVTLAVGLADQNDREWAVSLSLVLFAATAMTTLSADYLVNLGEARIKELT
ncbi:hypothetical protein [Plantactinospora sp. B5E13]|uniref:hypothetical protein n=1 Tax=Plantactinospora sp. B5E13 TaxID=3153758 RepID=UPI00325DD62D